MSDHKIPTVSATTTAHPSMITAQLTKEQLLRAIGRTLTALPINRAVGGAATAAFVEAVRRYREEHPAVDLETAGAAVTRDAQRFAPARLSDATPRLRDRRMRLGLSKEELAIRLGITADTYTACEDGGRCPMLVDLALQALEAGQRP
ncbi:MAG: helix-turn-helix transcriptional regulator [Pseudomonadota bacterium]